MNDGFERPKLLGLMLGVSVALALVSTKLSLPSLPMRTPLTVALLTWISSQILATASSIEPRTSLLGNYAHQHGLLVSLVMTALVLLGTVALRNAAARARLALGVAAGATLLSLYSVLQALGLDPLGWPPLPQDARRTFATIGHPDVLGQYLALSLPFSIWLVTRKDGLGRCAFASTVGVQCLALILTGARGAWLGAALGGLGSLLLLFSLRAGRPGLSLAASVMPLMLSALVPLALVLTPSLTQMVNDLANQVSARGPSVQIRVLLWESALAAIKERPLLGWGPDTFELIYPRYRSPALDAAAGWVVQEFSPHNLVIEEALNAGLLGLAARLLMYGAAFISLARAARESALRPIALLYFSILSIHVWSQVGGVSRIVTDALAAIALGGTLALTPSLTPPLRIHRIARYALLTAAMLIPLVGVMSVAADAVYREALSLARAGRPEPALDRFRLTLQLNPWEPTYRQSYARALGETGLARRDPADLGEATRQWALASGQLQNQHAAVLLELARASSELDLLQQTQSSATASAVQRALELDPLNPLIHLGAAELASDRGDAATAQRHWDRARELAETADALLPLGQLAYARGDLPAARHAFMGASRREWRAGYRATPYRWWAITTTSMGHPEEAELALREALTWEPDNIALRLDYAETLLALGSKDQARAELGVILRQDPANRRALALQRSVI